MAGLQLGGMPTDVDVERLRQEIGVPEPGQTVAYEAIEEVLRLSHTKSRWRTVVTAWRRRLDRENNVVLKAISNIGFQVLDGHGRVDFGTRTYKGGLRRINKAAVLAVRTERKGLDSAELRTIDHIATVGAQLRLAAATAARELRYADPETKRLVATNPGANGNGLSAAGAVD